MSAKKITTKSRKFSAEQQPLIFTVTPIFTLRFARTLAMCAQRRWAIIAQPGTLRSFTSRNNAAHCRRPDENHDSFNSIGILWPSCSLSFRLRQKDRSVLAAKFCRQTTRCPIRRWSPIARREFAAENSSFANSASQRLSISSCRMNRHPDTSDGSCFGGC